MLHLLDKKEKTITKHFFTIKNYTFMKKTLWAVFLLCLTTSIKVSAQFDLEKEILGACDSSEIIINKGRNLANNKLNNRDFSNLLEIIDYTRVHSDQNKYIAFYPVEEQLFCLLSGDLDRFFVVATKNIADPYVVHPQTDYLASFACSIILEEKDVWKKWYEELSIEPDKKQTLRVFLGYIGLYDEQFENRAEVKSFSKKYPESEYKEYVSRYKNNFNSGSFEYHLGGGLNSLYGDVLDLIESSKGTLSMGLDFSVNRFFMGIMFYGSNGKIQDSYNVSPKQGDDFILYKGDIISILNAGSRLGWIIFQKNRIRITPTLDISGFSISSSIENDRNDESVSINTSFGLGAGVLADFSLFSWNVSNSSYYYDYSFIRSSIALRFTADYQKFLVGKKSLGGSGLTTAATLVWKLH